MQYRPELCGGAMMDLGCYCVDLCRFIAGCDDAEIIRARSGKIKGIDGETRAELRFRNGIKATVIASMVKTMPSYAIVNGSKGSLYVQCPFPSTISINGKLTDLYRLVMWDGSGFREFRVDSRLTYACQIEAFRDAVHAGKQPLTDARSGIANMKIIDAILAKAGVALPYPKNAMPK